MIPRRLVRTVPADTTDEVEAYWSRAVELHPGWDHVTYRDPIDPDLFPITAELWPRCRSGAQRAGLIRLEALAHHGGVYIDSDFEPYRPLDPLLHLPAFAGWEDAQVVPDAVLGAEAHHPAILACLDLAIGRLIGRGRTWRDDNRAWATGPGVTTTILPGRTDVLLLPPGSLYPVHYSAKESADWAAVRAANPWAFGAHRWAASWL
jgi:glycosyl transferase-like sugar-binding protein